MLRLIIAAFWLIITEVLSQSEVNFICKSGHILNGTENICDGKLNCYDGSDEATELCAHIFCPPNYFKCNYGACVHRSKNCNGIIDCEPDSSDESNCGRKWNSCGPTEFNCGFDKYINFERSCIDGSKICDGTSDCVNGADEHRTICENALCPDRSFRCRYGACVSESVLCDGFIDCLDGSDEAESLCINLKCPKCKNFIVCPPLIAENIQSTRIVMNCEWNEHEMPCTQNILPGTKVFYRCKNHHKPKSAKNFGNDWNLCQADGTWLRDTLECEPDCGRLDTDISLATNNWMLSETLPWHASLFIVGNHQKPAYICGATLISEAVVVTAAHCVWEIKVDDLRIGVGNRKPNYENSDDFWGRFYTARSIIVHPTYFGQLGNFGSDIALIEISQSVEIDETIFPVCIDWNLDDISLHIANESLGIIVGLDSTENATSNSSFHITNMPLISHEYCVEQQPPEFQKYVSFTTFCAGWGNGTSVCNGDSGAGIVIPKASDSNRYYLQGIASLGTPQQSTDHCDPYQFTIFTKVGIYTKWIESHLNRINERLNDQLSDETSFDSAAEW